MLRFERQRSKAFQVIQKMLDHTVKSHVVRGLPMGHDFSGVSEAAAACAITHGPRRCPTLGKSDKTDPNPRRWGGLGLTKDT